MKRNYQLLTAAMEDGSPPEMIADWLQDTEHELHEVLHLFAGSPPHWNNGIKKDVLACWLECVGDPRHDQVRTITVKPPERPTGHAPSYHFVGYRAQPYQLCPGCEPGKGHIRIGVHLASELTTLDGRTVRYGYCTKCHGMIWSIDYDWVEVKDMKKRVLSLFAEVMVTHLRTCGNCCGNRRGNYAFSPCEKCNGTGWIKPGGTVSAARLIV